jgi:hypothetical protein
MSALLSILRTTRTALVFGGALALTTNAVAQDAVPAPAVSSPNGDVASSREAARAEFSAGQAAYAAGNYAEAEAHFAKADALVPSVQAKYNRAMALDQLGRPGDALAAFEAVLAAPGHEELGPDKLSQVQQRAAELRNAPADLALTTTPPGATVNVNGMNQPGATPLTLRLAAGRHRITLEAAGYAPQVVELTVKPGERVERSFDLASSSAAPPPATAEATPSEGGQRSRAPGYVTLGIAGASAVVGTVFGLKALSNKSDFDDAPSTSRADDVERNALIADMAFGVALTLGVTGIVLLVADDVPSDETATAKPGRVSGAGPSPARRQAIQLEVAPYVSPRGAGAGARLSF